MLFNVHPGSVVSSGASSLRHPSASLFSELTSPIKIHGAATLDHNVLSSLFALNNLRPRQQCLNHHLTYF